jgi:hypothetical protein
MKINYATGLIVVGVLYGTLALAAQSGTMIKPETLYASPAGNSARLGSVSRGAPVTVIKRQGGWLQVASGRSRGWVRLLSVRTGAAYRSNGAADIVGMAQMATGKRQPGQIVATAGVRGLNEEDLKEAHYSADGIAQLERYTISGSTARSFAAQGGLRATSVAYLPNPAQGGR